MYLCLLEQDLGFDMLIVRKRKNTMIEAILSGRTFARGIFGGSRKEVTFDRPCLAAILYRDHNRHVPRCVIGLS
jgi:hypothetical protein